MKISYNWLKQYIDTDLSPRQVSEILTNTGLEVEGLEEVQSVKGGLEGVVIGEVLSCEKHPDADKLTVTTVNLGDGEPVQIVCGAPNVATGQKVPVATVGTTLWPDEEGFTIKKAKIRGVPSMGMICAEDELGLGTSHEGIMVLEPEALAGTPAADYFHVENDFVFEIGLTPNRIDGASHLGVARDLAAFLKQSGPAMVKKPSVEAFHADNNKLYIPVEIEEKAGCKRYSGVTIQGISVKESPAWLQKRLKSVGLTPINNVVDITNYVLYETGQPLHAFDADQIRGHKVIIRTMPEGTPFVTLDEQERKLRSSDLMICNTEDGMCIAGVFGGIASGVTEKTSSIFLESACFDPVYVRKTARHHQLNTDASFRFERGSDPNMTVWALKRAAMLIKEIAGGSISSELVDVYPAPVEDFPVEISFAHVDRLIGNHMEPAIIRSILESLEIRVEKENDQGMVLRVPPYRVDVQREADVIEEILRIYGFNRVEITNGLRSTLSSTSKPDKEQVVNMCSDLLSANGFFELKSNSLTPSSYYDKEETQDPKAVRLFNPLSQDLALMRQTLLYGGLEAIAYNINRKQSDLKLYEFGNCYFRDGKKKAKNPLEKYEEAFHMGIFLSGNVQPGNWVQKAEKASFHQLKTYVELVLTKLGIDPMVLECTGLSDPDFDDALAYNYKSTSLVVFGQVSRHTVKKFDIKQQVYAAEFNWDLIMQAISGHRVLFNPLSRFQIVTRDFSLMLDRKVTFESLRTLAFKAEKKLLKKVTLFDVYEGDKIEKGKKSYALTFTLLDKDKTLTDKQIDKAMLRIARAFEQELGASVRGM
ncbi:MAG: phenylalanine--tRNA ligase subunit beta [Bacteroidota bacterium]|nr:phenylalanine--tRNA ligase subunit beta [Bacteroidota bacterium]